MSDDWQRQDEAVQMMLNRLDVASTGLYMTSDERKLRELCGSAADMIRKLMRAYMDELGFYDNLLARKNDYKRQSVRR